MPEESVLWQVLAEHLETCGRLSRGFPRVHCTECGKDELIAFSCKGHGFCPCCGSRRMADLGAHLVDARSPEMPLKIAATG